MVCQVSFPYSQEESKQKTQKSEPDELGGARPSWEAAAGTWVETSPNPFVRR